MIFIFFLFPFTNIKWNMLSQGFQKFYESITEVPETIFFNKKWRCLPPSSPRLAGCLARKEEKVQNPLDGPRFKNFYLHPHFTKYTPILLNTPPFCVFLPISFRNLPKLYGFWNDAWLSFCNVAKLYGFHNNACFDFRNVCKTLQII